MSAEQRTGTLDVYLLGRRVGRIDYRAHRNEMRFCYASDYLACADVEPLSHSLPLQPEPFDSDRTTVFFENLLPPDVVRRKLGPVLHLSRHNVFGFLAALGGDCAGAIALWPHGEEPHMAEETVQMLSEAEADGVLKALKKRPLYVNGIDGYRISGAGAQSKLIVRLVNGQIGLPLFGTASSHVVKPPVEDYPNSVYNEFFSMRLAERMGLKTAQCGLIRIKDTVYYWTERFDREMSDGHMRRLHQEDFCQVTGVSGELKYESEGGPSFRSCISAMRDMRMSLSDQLAFIDRMVFNFLIGNADAHGKNSSVIYRGKERQSLAPAYDLLCTAVYDTLSQANAMSIGGAWTFDEVSRDSFSAMAREVEMRSQLVLRRLDALAGKMPARARQLAEELSLEWPSEVYAKICRVIERHCIKVSDRQ